MKTLNSLLVITVIALLMSCDAKEVNLYPSFTHTAEVVVNQEGAYDEAIDIFVSEISEAIADLDTDGGILDVMIEGMFLEVTPNAASGVPENSASRITSSIVLTDWNGGEHLLIEDLSIELTEVTQEVNLQSSLRKAGVKQFRDILFAIAQNDIPAGKEKVGVRLTGSPTPSGSYINVELKLKIKIVVEYKTDI